MNPAGQATDTGRPMSPAASAFTWAAWSMRVCVRAGRVLHGKWYFGTARSAAKARHLAARPAASVAHRLMRQRLGA
jgi:hypothetical protein